MFGVFMFHLFSDMFNKSIIFSAECLKAFPTPNNGKYSADNKIISQ